MQSARTSLGRAARGALFAAGAVALSECSSSTAPQPLYGASCMETDACGIVEPDASKDASAEAAPDAPADAPADAADESD